MHMEGVLIQPAAASESVTTDTSVSAAAVLSGVIQGASLDALEPTLPPPDQETPQGALDDFEECLRTARRRGDNFSVAEKLEALIAKHRGLFMPFLTHLLNSGRMDLFHESIDHEDVNVVTSVLTVALEADPKNIGGNFKDWMLTLSAEAFGRFWLDMGDKKEAVKRMAVADSRGKSVDVFSAQIVSCHASHQLSGFKELRDALDRKCPTLAERVKIVLKRCLFDGCHDDDQERWFMDGNVLKEAEEDNDQAKAVGLATVAKAVGNESQASVSQAPAVIAGKRKRTATVLDGQLTGPHVDSVVAGAVVSSEH